MGGVYPRKSRKTGKVVSYRVCWFDEHGERQYRTVPKDKAMAEAILLRQEARVAAIKAGLIDLAAESCQEELSRPLEEHLSDYLQSLRDKRRTERHIADTERHCKRVIEIIGARRATDIRLGKVESALGEVSRTKRRRAPKGQTRVVIGEGNSNATRNRHRAAIRAFTAWLCRVGRIPTDPLKGVETLEEEATTCRERRTLGPEDYRRLVWAAATAPPWRKVSGIDRALVYLLAGATGFRHNEIRALKVSDFQLEAEPATVRLGGRSTKNSKRSAQPIPKSLAEELATRLAGRKPGETAFPMPYGKGAAMLRFDLARCEPPIPYQDEQGRYYDFHSIRQETATLLFASGADIGVVRKVMRHSSVALTSRYTNPIDAAVIQAVSSVTLPGLPRPADDERGPPVPPPVPPPGQENASEGESRIKGSLGLCLANPLFPGSNPGGASEENQARKTQGSPPIRSCADSGQMFPGEHRCAPESTSECPRCDSGVTQDPDFGRVAGAWDRLPEAIRTAILSLVDLATKKPPAE